MNDKAIGAMLVIIGAGMLVLAGRIAPYREKSRWRDFWLIIAGLIVALGALPWLGGAVKWITLQFH